MHSSKRNFRLNLFKKEDISDLTSLREGETKIGEKLGSTNSAKFIILGIEESFGPRANHGRSGSQNAFRSFLSKFLNMQSNETMDIGSTAILGRIVPEIEHEYSENLNELVVELDDFIYRILNKTLSSGQIPIVIGGGHNNAYPLIKTAFHSQKAKIRVVNLDAHADYRPLEGRHSGNSFSYAYNDGFMEKYSAYGLHQRYNSQKILSDLRNDMHFFSYLEDYLDGNRDWLIDFKNFRSEVNSGDKFVFTGIELDMDTIEYMPSSAFSPVGISMETARKYIRIMAGIRKVAYLHLPEGAPKNSEEELIVGKALAYLVTDFISVHGGMEV